MPRHFKCLIIFILAVCIAGAPHAYAQPSITLEEHTIIKAQEPVKIPEPVRETSSENTSAESFEIEFLRNEAETARAFADKMRKVVEKWKERAVKARENAEKARHKRDREGWLDDARDYDERAESAAITADKAEATAAKAEAKLEQELKKLERDPAENPADTQDPEPSKSTAKKDKPKYQAVPLEKTIGT